MRTKRVGTAVAVALVALAAGCGGGAETPAAAQLEGLALVSIQPSPGPASLSATRPTDCIWCTTAFSAELSVASPTTLAGVNLWLDGWSAGRRCLTAHHDTPGDGFTLAADRPTSVTFRHASVDCAAPFTVDRVVVRMRSGETLVSEGAWDVALRFVE